MSRLIVEAVWNVSDFQSGSQDTLVFTVSVSDVDGNAVTTLTKDDFSLNALGGFPTGALDQFGQVALLGGFYELFIVREPPDHLSNGEVPVGISVSSSDDHGQTLVNVLISGRPALPGG